MKRKFTSEVYAKMGHPDLGNKIYFMKDGKKIWRTVSLLSFNGLKNAKKGLVLLGIEPFKKRNYETSNQRQTQRSTAIL